MGVMPDSGHTFTMIGIPDKDPAVYYLSPNGAYWHSGVWSFFNPPNDVFQPGPDPGGMQSPCTGCSISRMTTIAQNGGYNPYSQSYFGVQRYGSGSPRLSIHWEQVTMGQLVQPCTTGQTQATCTLKFFTDPNVWGGGFQNFPNAYVSESAAVNNSNDPYETYDGIDNALTGTASVGSYVDPRPGTNIQRVIEQVCDTSGGLGTFVYYQGDTNYAGDTVPTGNEEIWTVRYMKNPVLNCS